MLAPTGSGDITKVELDGSKQYRISNGNFLACTEGITLEAKAKVKGIFGSGEGFVARFRGPGQIWIQTRTPIVVASNG